HLRLISPMQIVDRPAAIQYALYHGPIDLFGETPRHPVAYHTNIGKDVQFAIGDLRPRHDDRLDPVAQQALCVQRDLVIMPIHHRKHVQAAGETQCILHLDPIRNWSVFKFKMAENVAWFQPELLLWTNEVEVTVASASWQL